MGGICNIFYNKEKFRKTKKFLFSRKKNTSKVWGLGLH